MSNLKNILNIVTVSTMFFFGGVVYAAQPAGEVIAMKGDVSAKSADGSTRPIMKSDQVFVGDQINTGTGAYAVVEFIDGARATLMPDSNLSVDKYAFGTNEDGVVLGLVKGGFRAITGEIARKRPESYTVQTNVATLGVRGSEFAIRLCEQDCVEEEEDRIQEVGGVYGHGYFLSQE